MKLKPRVCRKNKPHTEYKMKLRKCAAVFCAIFLCWITVGVPVLAQEIPGVPSLCYIAIDADTGEVLGDRNADVPVYPASTTKVMTAMTVMDVLQPNAVLIVNQDTLSRVNPSNSKAGIRAGGEYYVYELLVMMLASSGGDAAQVLAEAAYQSADGCVAKMNERAQAMGLKSTHFDNIYGLDIGDNYAGTYTTAREFAQIMKAAQQYEIIRTAMGLPVYTISERTNNPAMIKLNTNAFLTTEPYNMQQYRIIGGKTGTTKSAGNVLAVTATNGMKNVICVCYYNPDRTVLYNSIRQILDYVYGTNAS